MQYLAHQFTLNFYFCIYLMISQCDAQISLLPQYMVKSLKLETVTYLTLGFQNCLACFLHKRVIQTYN